MLKFKGTIHEINYSPTICKELELFQDTDLRANNLARRAALILQYRQNEYALSQWVSPKRTRSYPYSRVYDTFGYKNRIAIIPFVKDEGLDGDRDYIQWDTVSLMSLLNVYVIISYYISAVKNDRYENKITSQVYDYTQIEEQIADLSNYQSSALHWNLKQMDNLHLIAKKSKTAYQQISNKLDVRMHSEEGIDHRIQIVTDSVASFRELSRELAEQAQYRETCTFQPKENVIERKASITLKNLLGGYYYFTVDECLMIDSTLVLIEKKHTKKHRMPNKNDVKDAFLKMVLFSNISVLSDGDKDVAFLPAVGLTSNALKTFCHSGMSDEEIISVLHENNLTSRESNTLFSFINEARRNQFLLFLMNSEHAEYQNTIFADYLKK